MSEKETFDIDEHSEILRHFHKLRSRGYTTALNIDTSANILSSESIIVHFLHDSAKHLDHVTTGFPAPYEIIPRRSFYTFHDSYFEKPDFIEEYASAKFWDATGRALTASEAKDVKRNLLVESNELDLVVPMNVANLEILVHRLLSANQSGPQPWIHPAVILRSESPLNTLKGFNQAVFVNLRRVREEVYTVVYGLERVESLKRYVRRSCPTSEGLIDPNSIVFAPSQINDKLIEYIRQTILPFSPFEDE